MCFNNRQAGFVDAPTLAGVSVDFGGGAGIAAAMSGRTLTESADLNKFFKIHS